MNAKISHDSMNAKTSHDSINASNCMSSIGLSGISVLDIGRFNYPTDFFVSVIVHFCDKRTIL